MRLLPRVIFIAITTSTVVLVACAFSSLALSLSLGQRQKNCVQMQAGSTSTSKNESENEKPTHYWTVCTTCRGTGKITKLPSRKARLRHKRAKLVATEGSSNNSNSTTIRDNKPPLRIEPCQACHKTGLVTSENAPTPSSKMPHVAIVGGGLADLP